LLENAGCTEIAADGQSFDPTVHEAISQAPGPEGKVVSVVQKGYKLGDRVLRPAMVVVGVEEPKADATPHEGDEREAGDETSNPEGQASA
ncbi:MAG: nucleotide exchange factor GrpE, partial [Dehalococcoidia bacterium]